MLYPDSFSLETLDCLPHQEQCYLGQGLQAPNDSLTVLFVTPEFCGYVFQCPLEAEPPYVMGVGREGMDRRPPSNAPAVTFSKCISGGNACGWMGWVERGGRRGDPR